MTFDPNTAAPVGEFDPSSAVPADAPNPRDTLKVATRVNPDQAAEAERLARRYPNPSDVVLRNLQDVKLQAAVDDADAHLKTDVPTLRAKMTELSFAQMSHDDSGPLSTLEGMIRQTGRSTKSGAFGASRGAAGLFQAGAEFAAPVLDVLEPDNDAELMGWRGSIGGNPLRRLAEGFAEIGRQNLQTQEGLRPQGEQGNIASGFFSGVESLTQNVLALPMAFAPGGQGAALSMMTATAGGQSYQDAREKGLGTTQALPFAASQAAIEYATERIPLTRLLGDVKAGTPIFQTLMRQIGAEIPGEQVATVLQDLNEWAVLHPDKPFTSYLEERPSAAAQTLVATIVGAGGNVAVAKGIEAVANTAVRLDAQLAKSDATTQRFADAMGVAGESKLRERAPATFAQFVQEAAENTEGAPTAVYVDPRAFTDALNQAGISDAQLAQMLPSVATQIAEAYESGTPIEIPIGEALAAVPGTPLEDVLLQNARTEPDGLSRLEVDEAAKQAETLLKLDADRIMAAADARAQNEEGAAQVKQTVLDQLNTAGRFRPEANDAYATMVGAFYSTMAQRLGVTSAEMYARYPLRVTGEMQSGGLGRGDLEQTTREAAKTGKEWTGIVLRGETGGTAQRAATDSGDYGKGIYFTGDESRANAYARGPINEPDRGGSVTSAMVTLRNPLVFKTAAEATAYRRGIVGPDLVHKPQSTEASALIDADLRAKGHDGVVVYDSEGNYTATPELPFEVVQLGDTLAQKTRATFSPSQMLIALGPNADYSSFLHESGHAFLEILSDVATQPGAPEQVAKDWQTTLDWFGVTPEQWAGMTLDEKRPYHERWAESTEQYFFEGRAPSVELRGVFDRFRTWLTSVYKSLKQFMAMRSATPGGMAGTGQLGQPGMPAFDQTQTPEFNAWFGDSKVVDENGEPLVVYHGSPDARFADAKKGDGVFKTKREAAFGKDAGRAFYFTTSPRVAKTYADPRRAFDYQAAEEGVLQTYLSIKNPLEVDGQGKHWREVQRGISKDDFVLAAKDAGHDGVVIRNVRDNYDSMQTGKDPVSDVYVAFNPEQIKSAIGNDGSFDANDPSILSQRDEPAAGPLGLSDEIRAVMDRLLATDEQITEAERVRQYGLLFKSPEEAGMTPEQWLAYTSEDAKAHAEALSELTRRNLKNMGIVMRKRMRALKDVQRDMAEKRKAVEAEASAQIAAEPVYRAMRWLKKGEMTTPEGEDIKAADGFKLDAAIVAELFPETALGAPDLSKLKGMTIKKGGLHPDVVAEMFGFADGAALITSIAQAFPQVDQVDGLTDQKMIELYGDMATARGQERAADEAVHNDNRVWVLAAELTAVSRANDARTQPANGRTANAMVEAAKLFAARVVEGKKVKDLKPQLYTAAETRAAKAAEKALAKGDTQAVILAKRDQVLNFQTARAVNAARTEALKIEAFFKKIASAKDDVVGKTRDLDVVKATQAILAAYGVGTKGQQATAYLDAVKANDPEMYATIEPSVTASLLNAKPLEQLTVDELRALNEEVQALWYLAKRSRQMEIDGNLLDRQDVEDALKARMLEIGIPESMPGDTSAITPAEQRMLKLKYYLAAARRAESWAQAMDGSERMGAFRRYVWQPVKEGADAYRTDKAGYLKRFRALLEPIQSTLVKRKIAAPELGYTFGEDTSGVGTAELLHAILHTGNDSNKRKLLLGRKWATENEDGTLDTSRWDAFVQRMVDEGVLRKEHFDFAQGVWDLLEEMKPLAQKTHRDVFGKYFAEVTANPVATPFGTYRGGYVPAIADSRIVSDKATKTLMEAENESMQFAFPTTNRGFTKGRVESYNRPLMLDLRTLTQHMDKVLKFSHLESPVRDVRKVLTAKGVAYGLNRIDPVAFDGVLTPWLNRAAKQVVETPIPGDGGLSRFFSAVRNRAGMAAMFANFANAAQQITGFSLAAVRVPPRYMLQAAASYAAAPKLTTQAVAEKSEYMASRMENEVSQMTGAINDILLDPNVYERVQAWTQKHAYFVQSAVDNVMGPIIWTGAYNQALERGATDKDAAREADSVIRETQGSTLPEDVSRLETGNPFVRMFTQFMGYFNMQANLLGTEFATVSRELGLRKGAGRAFYVMLMGFLVPAWTAEAIMQTFRGEPDDEDKDGEYLDDWLAAVFGMSILRGATAMVPGAGPVLTTVFNTFNDKPYDDRISTSPAIAMIETAVKVPSEVYTALADDSKEVNAQKLVRDTATLANLLTGIPFAALAKPLGYAAAVEQGKVSPTSPADAARGAITGVASPESKR